MVFRTLCFPLLAQQASSEKKHAFQSWQPPRAGYHSNRRAAPVLWPSLAHKVSETETSLAPHSLSPCSSPSPFQNLMMSFALKPISGY